MGLPEKHANTGLDELLLDVLPRLREHKDLALGERLDRQVTRRHERSRRAETAGAHHVVEA